MAEAKRRTFLNKPGEALLLTGDPVEYIRRFDDFLDASNLSPEKVLATPLLAVPIPVATRGEDGRPQRWAEADPAFMWHPLMWLPAHLALRYHYRTIDQELGGRSEDFEVEPDSVWAIRVGLELVASGLYNPDDGSWLDVLALHGIDIDDPVDFARVEQWLRGVPDVVLDAIDLTSMVTSAENPERAVQSATDLASVLVPAEWSIISSGIIGVIQERVAEDGDGEESMRLLITVMGQVAAQALHDVPPDPETGEDLIDTIGAITEEASLPEANLPLMLESLLEALSGIARDYAASVAVLNQHGE